MIKKRSATTLCRALPDYYRSGLFSDVKLLFFDNGGGGGEPRLEIRMHKFVLYSGAVPILTRLMDRDHYNDLRSDDTIRLELNFSEFDEAIVRFFFGLIYHNKLSQALAESPEMNATLEENILHLHQLAGYFGFVALLTICQDRMYRMFSADTVNQLSTYCLHPLSGHAGHYFVPEEKYALYTKLLHWYQLCVDDATPDALFATTGDSSPRCCKSNKTVVIGQKKKYVENFSRFQLPPAGVSLGQEVLLHHYRRVCGQCVRNPRLVHKKENAVINMGSVGAWSFSMTHKLADKVNMMLFLKHQSPPQSASSSSEETDDHMSVESSSSSSSSDYVRLQCRVGLFSQRDDGLSACSEETSNNLGELTRIACVKLHSEDDCYESVCDCCRRVDPVFIFCISVNIIK